MQYVYVLKSIKFDWYYKGLSDNVNRRYEEHNKGWVKKTKFYAPFRLIHVEIVSTLLEARGMEKYLKSGYGREVLKQIEEELDNIPR